MSNYSPPVVKITMRHAGGGISLFRAEEARDLAEKDPVKEAIITVFASVERQGRMEVIRSDMGGKDWEALRQANAVPEMMARLDRSARDLEKAGTSKVVLQVDANGGMHNARLFTNEAEAEAELAAGPDRRALIVPKDLPFQFGGTVDGASAVIYQPQAGGGPRLHSLHPNDQEAKLAAQYLQSQGEPKTGILPVQTPVTSLLRDVLANAYRPTAHNMTDPRLAELNGDAPTPKPKSPFAPPSPFARPTPMTTT
jgi:hypothetical protein